MKLPAFLRLCFVGISQIFLQNNILSGIIIALGMFFSHWSLGISCILGSALGSLMAIILKYKRENIDLGLYGFNSSLAYMCVIFTFGLEDNIYTNSYYLQIWLLGAISSLMATYIMHLFVENNKTAYTFPFVLTCWITCYLFSEFHTLGLIQTTPELYDFMQEPLNKESIAAIESPFFGWAEVDFGASIITGFLVFLGIAIANPNVAMWATTMASIGELFAYYIFHEDPNLLINGIYGFSPILVACAFAGNQFKDFIYVILGTLLAVTIQYSIHHITLISDRGWATYTIGFILASWIIIAIKKYMNKASA